MKKKLTPREKDCALIKIVICGLRDGLPFAWTAETKCKISRSLSALERLRKAVKK
jgi:hypothetical protein